MALLRVRICVIMPGGHAGGLTGIGRGLEWLGFGLEQNCERVPVYVTFITLTYGVQKANPRNSGDLFFFIFDSFLT